MIKVILAEDHHLVRAGIRSLLERAPDIKIIGEAENGMEAIQMAQQLTPDVVVMDINMPHLNGIAAIKQMQEQSITANVVILSMYSDATLVRQAIDSGAKGYVLKQSVSAELPLAVRAAAQGKSYLCMAVADDVLQDYRVLREQSGATNPIDALTSRERQVFQLIAEGQTNREAAQIMNLSERTVEKHRANLMEKMALTDLTDLIKSAIKHGIISIHDE